MPTIRVPESVYKALLSAKQHPRETMGDVLARLLKPVTKPRKPAHKP